jgi:hypothetical protein
MTSKIDSIGTRGKVDVVFNSSMVVKDKSLLNSSFIDIYIEPANDRHLDEGVNISKLNLTWVLGDITDDTVTFKLNFSDPIYVSPMHE